jgi:hypothetical protein
MPFGFPDLELNFIFVEMGGPYISTIGKNQPVVVYTVDDAVEIEK